MSLPNVPMLNCDSWTMLLNHINFILKEYYLVLKYSSYKWAILGTETNASQTEFVHSDVNIVVTNHEMVCFTRSKFPYYCCSLSKSSANPLEMLSQKLWVSVMAPKKGITPLSGMQNHKEGIRFPVVKENASRPCCSLGYIRMI